MPSNPLKRECFPFYLRTGCILLEPDADSISETPLETESNLIMIPATAASSSRWLSYQGDPPPDVDGPPIKGPDLVKMTKLSLNADSVGFDDTTRQRTRMFDRIGDYELIIAERLDGDETPWQGYCRDCYLG